MSTVGDITNFTTKHRILLALACTVIFFEIAALIVFHTTALDWLSHNLWVVLIPFTKVILKHILALKLVVFLKAFSVLALNLSKLLALKFLKTLGLRYGVFFSQNRWHWIRRIKVMFLRRGKQFFRSASRFWSIYSASSKCLIVIAFFPLITLLFLLGLSLLFHSINVL